MKINFILTAFSPAMFGERATAHLRTIPIEEARKLVDANTQIMSTRITHERLARNLFPHASSELTRFANLRDGVNALHIHYRGSRLDDTGRVPAGASVTIYLIETETYHEMDPGPAG